MPSDAVTDQAWSLMDAADRGVTHPRVLSAGERLSLEAGYELQRRQIQLRRERGERVIGYKLGVTTSAQRETAGIRFPTLGTLTSSMVLDGPLRIGGMIQPKVEPEMAVIFAHALSDTAPSDADIDHAIGSIHAGLEIVDSRYPDSEFIPADAVADNGSARAVVWSSLARVPADITMAGEEVIFDVSGQGSQRGSGSALMGDPLIVVREAVREILRRGFDLPAGCVIFSGNLVEQALPVRAGDVVTAEFSTLGRLSLDVID